MYAIAVGNAGCSDSGNDAAEKEPANGRRKRHHDVIETKSQAREQQHRPPADSIRQNADYWRKEKLHRREHGQENAVPIGRAFHVVV